MRRRDCTSLNSHEASKIKTELTVIVNEVDKCCIIVWYHHYLINLPSTATPLILEVVCQGIFTGLLAKICHIDTVGDGDLGDSKCRIVQHLPINCLQFG